MSSRPMRRSQSNRMIGGVLGGVAQHFGWDATVLRVVYVVVSILSVAFPGILIYLLAWLLIPLEGEPRRLS
ncbi:MAG: PspC domain-containing protein [Xanthomonadaceae bacterium]|nr:PspC domain-containing protein [Xanthomonadaceae bacterium]